MHCWPFCAALASELHIRCQLSSDLLTKPVEVCGGAGEKEGRGGYSTVLSTVVRSMRRMRDIQSTNY